MEFDSGEIEESESLNVEPSDDLSSDLKQARILWQHFKDQGLDIVSHIHESSILLTFASRDLPSRISIVDESGATKFNLSGLLSSAPPKVDGKLVNHTVQVDRALSRGALGVLLFADPEASLVTAERQLVTPAQLGLMQALHGDPSTPDKQAVVHGENNAKLECVPVEVISPESAEQIVRHMLANDDTPGSSFGKSNSIFNRATGFSNINHKIKLEVNFINVVRVFHSVMAGIRGSREPDRHILLVTSRESLLNNELGPTGGTAAMMELAKVFGVLLNTKGWRPHRSIVFCNLGLAFMEGHYISPPFMDSWGDLLESNVVSYLSVDNPVADNRSLEVEVSPLLSKVVQDSSALVPNPRLLEVMGNSQRTGFRFKIRNSKAASNSNLDIDSDPGLRSHKAMTQLWGILTWKMADSLLLPFSPTSYADFLNNTLTAIETKYKRVISENKLVLSELNSAIKNLSIAVSLFQKKMDTVDKSE
uniref:Peptidase M28 domain-containing protein n=1 Tax=Timema genevievae TaxID=629358 RepID=A0A7R9K2P4_TIMGE|nr:unnamed protein product [Timema genevievae]